MKWLNRLQRGKELDHEFLEAVLAGDTALTRRLIQDGADVTVEQNSAIESAARKGHEEMVHLLIEAGADLHHKNEVVLRSACGGGHGNLARWLLEQGAQVNAFERYGAEHENTPLAAAAHGADAALVSLLLDRGADVNQPTGSGTALHAAAERLNAGATTADRAARELTSVQVAEILLDHGALIDATGDFGATPLHCARSSDLVRLLLQRGADPNHRDQDGYTPLMRNVKRRFDHGYNTEGILEMLVAYGADPSIATHHGETPLRLAQRAVGDGSNTTVLPILLAEPATVRARIETRFAIAKGTASSGDLSRWYEIDGQGFPPDCLAKRTMGEVIAQSHLELEQKEEPRGKVRLHPKGTYKLLYMFHEGLLIEIIVNAEYPSDFLGIRSGKPEIVLSELGYKPHTREGYSYVYWVKDDHFVAVSRRREELMEISYCAGPLPGNLVPLRRHED